MFANTLRSPPRKYLHTRTFVFGPEKCRPRTDQSFAYAGWRQSRAHKNPVVFFGRSKKATALRVVGPDTTQRSRELFSIGVALKGSTKYLDFTRARRWPCEGIDSCRTLCACGAGLFNKPLSHGGA